jgi:hypothetical protein
MGEQVGKLIKAGEAPGIVIQVFPFTANEQAGTDGRSGSLSALEAKRSPTPSVTAAEG